MKNFFNKKNLIISLALLLALCITVLGTYYFSKEKKVPLNNMLENSINEKPVTRVSGLLPEKTMDDLILESSVVVHGKIVGKKSFKIKPAGGGDAMIFTDFYLKPVNILRGNEFVTKSKNITVRIMGGETEDAILIDENAPKLEEEKEYLMFLYSVSVGGTFCTKGEQYYLSNAYESVFDKMNENSFKPNGKSKKEEVNLKKFMKRMEDFNKKSPPVKDYMVKEADKNLEQMVKDGFMTQEERNRHIKAREEYATIIE